MNRKRSAFAPLVAASGLALLLSTASFAAPAPQEEYHFRTDRISTQGEITAMSREGDQYRVVLNHGSYAYLVPMATIRNRDIRIGAVVRIGGIVNGDSVSADYIAFTGEPTYTSDPYYRGVPFGSNGWLSGTVLSTNRRLNFITIRDDSTGIPIKIDVRSMDTRRSVNVWRTRPGDHISINGAWENRDTFNGALVQY
jgi:hypothetical protein